MPNTEAVYGALRNALPAGNVFPVKDFTLVREGGTFHFTDGSFMLYAPVRDHVTGAVFIGKGDFELAPKSVAEQKSLAFLTKGAQMHEDFTIVGMRFSDETAGEIIKASSSAAPGNASAHTSAAQDLAHNLRTRLHDNVAIRLLADVTNPDTNAGGYFLASFRAGGFFGGKNVIFTVDPQQSPDQVTLQTWDSEGNDDTWAAYPLESGKPQGSAAHVSYEDIDLSMERNGKLAGHATITLEGERDNTRIVRFSMYPTLRVAGVYAEDGTPLDFIQEGKDDDPQFAIELPQPLKSGQQTRVLIDYHGPDAVQREGEDVYDLVHGARESWYPADEEPFAHFASYRMTFHVPKNLQVIATGDLVSSTAEGGDRTIIWEASKPIPAAGFSVGAFQEAKGKTPDGFDIEVYANTTVPDWVTAALRHGGSDSELPSEQPMQREILGQFSSTDGLKDQLAQGNAAIQVYSSYFGKLPYDHVSLAQQNSCLDGQGWPTMVYLPVCAFWDATEQHSVGLRDFGIGAFWSELTPHEVSHQWWGDLIGIASYRDNWLSEGFATFSAGLYLRSTRKTMDDYRAYWKEQHEHLVAKNRDGLRPVDIGPLTMGYRVNTSKTGDWNAQYLIYGKGAYILHMLEMMYWTPQQKEEPFKNTLHEYVKEYAGKAATTEDFKAVVEKTMPKWLDLEHNGKLDWFFNEYVYGTELPHYEVISDFTQNPDGTTTMHFKITQSKVSPQFLMSVPLYLQMQNGETVRFASIILKGDSDAEKTVNIGKLPAPAKKMIINYNADVLTD